VVSVQTSISKLIRYRSNKTSGQAAVWQASWQTTEAQWSNILKHGGDPLGDYINGGYSSRSLNNRIILLFYYLFLGARKHHGPTSSSRDHID
jgi:hypothetical protein